MNINKNALAELAYLSNVLEYITYLSSITQCRTKVDNLI